MYRIGIVEVRCTNHEVAPLCKIADAIENRITLFTTGQMIGAIKEELKESADNIEFCVKEDDESLIGYMKRISKVCADGYDLVILNTVRNPEFLFFKPNCKVVGFFYNLNWWFNDVRSFTICFKKLFSWQNLKYPLPLANAVTGPFLRRLLLWRIDGVLVEYPNFVGLLNNTYGLQKPVYFLPNRFFEGSCEPTGSEKVTFVITGTISDVRRDYDTVLDAMSCLATEVKNNTKLILLGKPVGSYGDRIISRAQQLAATGLEIDFSTDFVPSSAMSQKLKAADVIISPLKLNYRSITVTERYTYTKGTGTFSDSISYAKPSLVPAEYNVANQFKDCFIKYHHATDLAEIITSLIEEPGRLVRLKNTAATVMKNYSLDKLRERFETIVAHLLST